jgi:linoleoyl-CoA desaturase
MNIIKFTPHDSHEKLFVQTLRKNINDYFKNNHLSTKANFAMVIKTIVMLSLYLVPYALILSIPMSAFLALLLTVLMGFGVAGVGMGVMHDACHGSYSQRQWVNKWLSGTLYLLGSNILNWKIQHNVLHHTYTNISGLDEDIDSKGPIRLSENKPLKWFHKFQFIYAFIFYGLMTLTMLINDFSRLFNYNKNGLVKGQNKKLSSEYIKMVFRKIIYLTVILGLPIWLTDFTVLQVLMGFFMMHWVASIILSFVFQMAHVVEGAEQPAPGHNIESDWLVHQLHTTSDFARNNKLIGWYVGGLNFQIEHHLFANICHIHYPKLAPIVERTAKEFGMPYNLKPSFGAALNSHIKRLKDLGVTPMVNSI